MKKKFHEMKKQLSIYKKENGELKQFNYELQKQVILNKGQGKTSQEDDIVRTDVSIFLFCLNQYSCQTEFCDSLCDGRNKSNLFARRLPVKNGLGNLPWNRLRNLFLHQRTSKNTSIFNQKSLTPTNSQ